MPFQALRPDLPMRLTPILHSPLFSYVWFGKYIRLVLRAYYIFYLLIGTSMSVGVNALRVRLFLDHGGSDLVLLHLGLTPLQVGVVEALLVRVALVATLPRRVHGFVPAPGQSVWVRVWVWLWTWMLGRVPVSVPAFNIGADVCVDVVCRR